MRTFYYDKEGVARESEGLASQPSEGGAKNSAGVFYITTTLPYVNAKPHLGFALEIIHADIIARYHKLIGDDVFFNFGTDEHGLKIYRKAIEENKDPQAYVDEYAARFDALKSALNLIYTNFIRTTDSKHKASAQEFWERCEKNGDIYKKNYKTKYCVGCELEKTDSELINSKCPIHPNLEIEIIDEENYFFRFSRYEKPLRDLYEKQPTFVVPDFRFNEIKAFVARGLQDFSISRLKGKMPWGIPVPNDPEQVIYVWFDALVNYISTIDWPVDMKSFEKWWPVVQFAGKDQIRMQAAMWQAMLMSAGLPTSKQIVIHGFINSGGQKMSKSLGNVIDPLEIVEKYGTDALRYWCAKEANTFEDSDFTWEKFKESYNADLANGLGNLVSRVMKMAVDYGVLDSCPLPEGVEGNDNLNKFRIQDAAKLIWNKIGWLDSHIQETEPFKKIKTDPIAAKKDVAFIICELYRIGLELRPFMPSTAEQIMKLIEEKKIPKKPLFPRVD